MNDAAFKLQKPPIIEAILDVDCDMPPGQDLATLEEPAKAAFLEQYPESRRALVQEHHIEAKPDQAPKISVRQQVLALQFLREDDKRLVQVRAQGFSFNKLAPYSTLDDYLPEIERTWRTFVVLASPVQIRAVRLRYINRILIPMEGGQVRLDGYIALAPRLPDPATLVMAGFLTQTVAVERETGSRASIVTTAQPPEKGALPVILDITAESLKIGEVENWTCLLAKIVSLRALKNRIFKKTLTERCLNLYQQH